MAFFDRFRVGIKKIRQEKDYPGLILALDDDDPGSRADAARTLSALGPSIIPNLLGALENAAPVSRVRMAEALVSIGTSSIPLILALIVRASPALQASFVRAIAATDGEYFSALLSSLHSEESTTRTAAVIALRGTGKKAIPHLVRRLQDRNHSVRKEAASSLAALGWVPNDPQEKVQYYYLLEDWTELAKLQGAAVPVLIKGLNSKDPRIRSESARTLGKIRDPRAIPALVRAADDPEADVRTRVIEALGEIGGDRAKPHLVEALSDPSHPVRMEAAWGLERLDWIPQNDLERANYLIAREQWNELVRMGRPAIAPLISALQVEYSGVRTGASEALRQLGQPALDALNAAVRSGNPRVREQAEIALEYIQSRREENARARPAQEKSSDYDRELKEGLAARKRIEDHFGKAVQAPTRPLRRKSPSPEQNEPMQPILNKGGTVPKPVPQQPPDGEDIESLLKESQKGDEAWTSVKRQLDRRKPAPLDQIIPAGNDKQAGNEKEYTEKETPAPEKPKDEIPPDLTPCAESPEPRAPVVEEASLERYLRALQSDNEEIRAAAIAALRSIGEPAVGFLIQALSDPHPGVRIAAAEGLGEIGGDSSVDALLLILNDADRDVRIAAAGALGQAGDARTILPLIGLFHDGYPEVRSAAAAAVAAFGHAALGPLDAALENPAPKVRVTAVKALGIVGDPRSIPLLVRHLEDPAHEVGVIAARTLAGFGQPAVEPLSAILRTGEKEGRLAAIDALALIGTAEADEALEYALRDRDRDVADKAAAALTRRRGTDVWRKTPDNEVRQDVHTLIVALKDGSVEVQVSAATRLIEMGRPAVEGLIMALKDGDPEIQAAAAGVLGEMREAAVEPLMAAMNDPDRFIRIVAARNLGNIGDKRAIGVLSRSLQREPDSMVRAAVAEALGYIGSEEAIEPLARALRDSDEVVQIAAARSLGYIGDKRAIEPLILALCDVDDRVRYAALEALNDPDGTVRDHLVGALRSTDEALRAGVAEALESVGWEPKTNVEKTLFLMARDRWAEVGQIGPDALPILVEALSNPSIEIRMNVVKTISRIGGEGAVSPLIQALADDALVVRMRAERGLVEMGDTAIPAITRAIEEARPEVREGLQRILEKIRR